MKKTNLDWTLIALDAVVAAAAIFGGISLLNDPTGASMGMPAEKYLAGTAFKDYRTPALLLIAFNGVVPIIVLLGAVMQRSWVRYGHVVVGAVLTGWMLVQLVMIGLPTRSQVALLGLGLLVLALSVVGISRGREPTARRPGGMAPA